MTLALRKFILGNEFVGRVSALLPTGWRAEDPIVFMDTMRMVARADGSPWHPVEAKVAITDLSADAFVALVVAKLVRRIADPMAVLGAVEVRGLLFIARELPGDRVVVTVEGQPHPASLARALLGELAMTMAEWRTFHGVPT